MGRSVPVKTQVNLQITNKINGFEHISYGTALICLFVFMAICGNSE
jgi:hypothetical protein